MLENSQTSNARLIPALALGALALAAFLMLRSTTPAPPPAAAPPAEGSIVVVELFTSQGCSSCPPADRLLSAIAADPKTAGRVVPLAYHVDYWDYIGWTDPFSSADWSARQKQYAQAYNTNRIYTPQVVINGTAEMTGSEERKVRAAIAKALAEKPAVDLALTVETLPGGLRAKVTATHAEALPRDADVLVALIENGLVTKVGKGENGGRTLKNDAVVRRLQKAFALGAAPGGRTGAVDFPLGEASTGRKLGVAVLVQDPKTRAIQGGAIRWL
ncbi:MAG TPA: DUF1223 domain-containing protein [Thermoanaerobaculia bacterium]|jgi:hypothetical protein|nr:DUF1223 domain-containing protein [Thermoanaerobaculia bacterium]